LLQAGVKNIRLVTLILLVTNVARLDTGRYRAISLSIKGAETE
jgi:hypothetical protein